MRFPLLILLTMNVTGAMAQDFRCIVPDEDRFYMDGEKMLGLRVIGSEVLERIYNEGLEDGNGAARFVRAEW